MLDAAFAGGALPPLLSGLRVLRRRAVPVARRPDDVRLE